MDRRCGDERQQRRSSYQKTGHGFPRLTYRPERPNREPLATVCERLYMTVESFKVSSQYYHSQKHGSGPTLRIHETGIDRAGARNPLIR